MICNRMQNCIEKEARAHGTLALQASQWQTHCDKLTQQYDAEMAECAEKVAEMERDLDELSAKCIEASEKLEHWDILVARWIYERPRGRTN